MSGEPGNLMPVFLRRIDARLERVEGDVTDIKRRLSHSEESGATMARSYASLQVRMDRIDNRLDRIERRLDLQDAHP